MKAQISWDCDCTAPRWSCSDCGGEGIFVDWMHVENLPLMGRPYALLSRQPIDSCLLNSLPNVAEDEFSQHLVAVA